MGSKGRAERLICSAFDSGRGGGTRKVKCPADPGLEVASYMVDFTEGDDYVSWSSLGTGPVAFTPSGAEFTISRRGQSPTIFTNWYFFFGQVEVHLRAAWGTGIVSSVVLESDDLDEIDWEWIGGTADQVQTNYFGKGNMTTWDRGGKSDMGDTQHTTHNYTIDWTAEAITWYVDGAAVRTLAYENALGGRNYPQTPMRVKLGIWAGGDPANAPGTIVWAGGETDYSKAPFTMYVERVKVTNHNPAYSYAYMDYSGTWGSIMVNNEDDGVSDETKGDFVVGDNGIVTESNIHGAAPKNETDARSSGTGSRANGAGAPPPSFTTAAEHSGSTQPPNLSATSAAKRGRLFDWGSGLVLAIAAASVTVAFGAV
ncbi:concanavalin A-like lectin/glucanase domain-containing protein [Lasiosphaeris hirsuta]|uniref:Crh-like protein n=1 Tax=Lasiosphaeris hirsuta TaxID=260670 RepID=A0AA40AI51_9PEZI|nr:concanavalin A-like lectin/glucanase domain-containing protein [Lasiosphaeris hirsuta]